MPAGPRGRQPAVSCSRLRNAATNRGRAAAPRARSSWNMGRRVAPGAEALARASAAAAGRATKATLAPRRAQAAQESRPGSRRGARCSSPRPGERRWPRCPRGWAGLARHQRSSRTRALRRRAGGRRRPEHSVLAPPPPWGLTTPDVRNARRLTGLPRGTMGARGSSQRMGVQQTPSHPRQ